MRNRQLLGVAALAAGAAILRFSTLDAQSFWADEAATVHLLRDGFGDMLSGVWHGESTPPLYYVLAWPWAKLFGTGEVGLRSLSALIGTATVPVVFSAARRLVGERAALVAAALTAVNPLLVWYSQEARAYALLVLLGALSLLALTRAIEEPSRGRLATWALTAALALASHYFALFLVLPEAIWLAWTVRGRAALSLAGLTAAGMALLPFALHQRSRHGAAFIEHSDRLERIIQVPKQFLVGFDAPAEVLLTVIAASLSALGLLLFARAGEPGRARRLLLALGGAALAIPLLLALAGEDYLITRNVIVAWIPLAIVVAAGLAVGRAGLTAAAALCAIGVTIVIAVAADTSYQRDDWRGAARALGRARVERAILVTPASGTGAVELYLPGASSLPPSGAQVREVDLVAIASHKPGKNRDRPRLDSTFPRRLGLRRVEARRSSTFAIERYRVGVGVGIYGAQAVLVQPRQ